MAIASLSNALWMQLLRSAQHCRPRRATLASSSP